MVGATILPGLQGASPLEFLAALGTLRALHDYSQRVRKMAPRLSWRDGTWHAMIHDAGDLDEICAALKSDAELWADAAIFNFQYPKIEKNGVKSFRGLNAPVVAWRAWLKNRQLTGDNDSLDIGAALTAETATEAIPEKSRPGESEFSAVNCPYDGDNFDRKTLPTAFDFTSRNAQFLDQVRLIREALSESHFQAALRGFDFESSASGRTLGWDPLSDRPAALYSYGSSVNPALEWLAFRGLVFFPVFGKGERLHTTACRGRRKNGIFTWMLWEPPASVPVVHSLLSYSGVDKLTDSERRLLGILQVFRVDLTKAADGYTGIFSPTRPV